MPGQGWAGSQANTAQVWRCALCLKDGKALYAETIIDGTMVCRTHVAWVSVPLNPPHEDS